MNWDRVPDQGCYPCTRTDPFHHVKVIKHFKQLGARLINGTYNGPAIDAYMAKLIEIHKIGDIVKIIWHL